MTTEIDRVVSFSIPPSDLVARKEIQKLKDHCKETGTNFSYLIIKAIKQLNKELKI